MNNYNDIFFNHLLKPLHLFPQERNHEEQVWPSVFILLCVLLLVLVKMRSFPKVLRIIQSTFSPQILQQLEREERNPFKFYALSLNILFLLNISFLCYKINAIYPFVLVDYNRFAQFCFFIGVLVLLSGFKIIVDHLLRFFTGNNKIFAEYSISSTILNQTFGLFLFPWIILIEFSNINPLFFLYPAFAVLIINVLIKWYRGIIMGLVEERIGVLQIFSYFCGLEILPVLVMVKYLIETF